jgi:hypothetical protein
VKDLEQLKRDEGGTISDDGLGLIFLKRAKLFKHYARYCVNYIGMAQRLATLRENPKIAGFFKVRHPCATCAVCLCTYGSQRLSLSLVALLPPHQTDGHDASDRPGVSEESRMQECFVGVLPHHPAAADDQVPAPVGGASHVPPRRE